MSDVTENHELKETLQIDVITPGHDPRVTTPLFRHTRQLLLERDGSRCFACGAIHSPAAPLEAHHDPVERSFAEDIDFGLLHAMVVDGSLRVSEAQLKALRAFDWDGFWAGAQLKSVDYVLDDGRIEQRQVLTPKDKYLFVDDMRVNGLLLCKNCHVKPEEGIHMLPYPILLARALSRNGVRFSDKEVIHHHDPEPAHG